MEGALDAKAGPASPSGNRVREVLELMLDISTRFAPQNAPDAATGGDEPAAAEAAGAAPAAGAVTGREQALRRLAEAAAWFKHNEPHSPLAFPLAAPAPRPPLPSPH